jgi:hypothetical protein
MDTRSYSIQAPYINRIILDYSHEAGSEGVVSLLREGNRGTERALPGTSTYLGR